jgi:hypothetical protein
MPCNAEQFRVECEAERMARAFAVASEWFAKGLTAVAASLNTMAGGYAQFMRDNRELIEAAIRKQPEVTK